MDELNKKKNTFKLSIAESGEEPLYFAMTTRYTFRLQPFPVHTIFVFD